eukprot:GHVU01105694.1.p2 GENE.GHVU01105694.1~~GHVU01105694.1.p2  ORF type:complete len:106 (+),score=23.29 GHVU01105694.1:310-627(+)
MLWIDKYQPRSLEELSCHAELTRFLKQLVAQPEQLPHLLFYGPNGAGKKTRIMALLREIYGEGIDKVHAETIQPEGTKAEFISISSPYHNQSEGGREGGRGCGSG